MKYAKTIILAVVAASVLVALLASTSASATVLCKKNEIPCPKEMDYPAGTTFHATLESETSSVFRDAMKNVVGTCTTSTIEGTTSNTGGTGKAVEGKLKAFTLGGCTTATEVPEPGEFKIHYVKETNTLGTLTFSGTKVSVTVFGSVCVYGAGAATDIGSMTGGAPATIDVNAVIPKLSGSFLCPTSIAWEAKYTVTVPEPLYFKDA